MKIGQLIEILQSMPDGEVYLSAEKGLGEMWRGRMYRLQKEDVATMNGNVMINAIYFSDFGEEE